MTTSINLLPWREEKREQKRRLFFIGLGLSSIIAIIIVIATYLIFNNLIEHQTGRNRLIEDEIARYNRQIIKIQQLKKVRSSLIARMNIIQQLQENRPKIVHFFDELVNVIPRTIYLLKAQRISNTIILTGHTDANSSVSLLMHNIRKNYWLNMPVLEEVVEVTNKKNTKLYKQFRLKVILKSLKKLREGSFDE